MNELDQQTGALALFGSIKDEKISTTRSIRINGKVTSVRLENIHWQIIREIADKEGLLLSQLMTKLVRLADSSQQDHTNFTSFVRVCCARYLEKGCKPELYKAGEISAGGANNSPYYRAIG